MAKSDEPVTIKKYANRRTGRADDDDIVLHVVTPFRVRLIGSGEAAADRRPPEVGKGAPSIGAPGVPASVPHLIARV